MNYEMTAIGDVPRLELAREFARMVHAKQTYDGAPYEKGHLDVVEQILAEAGKVSEDDIIIGRLHDAIEDAPKALQKLAHDFVKDNFSDHVYHVVWAMTGIGATRTVRNQSYYAKIALYPPAADYKVADRIANMENGKVNNQRLYSMYLREDASFYEKVASIAGSLYLKERYERVAGRRR
jgi:(p)ppGpp synthase/HD superfamily hydrolase